LQLRLLKVLDLLRYSLYNSTKQKAVTVGCSFCLKH
jgi:hypothetical protein